MNDSIEILKNKISSYEYILEVQLQDIENTRKTIKELKEGLMLKQAEERINKLISGD
jgi:hypothetical protein